MKTITLFLLVIVASFSSFAQQNFPSGVTIGGTPYWNWHISRSGSGTFNQSLLFAVTGGTAGATTRARLTQWGGLSLGTTTIASDQMLAVSGNGYFSGTLKTDGNVYFNDIANYAGLRILFPNTSTNNGGDVDLTIDTNSGAPIVDWNIKNWWGTYTFNRGTNDGSGNTVKKQLFRIDGNGNIVVPEGNALIDGKVNCEEVKVELLDIPDYVFEPEYNLRSLKETKEFITTHKHLPEIPSEKEIIANGGFELGNMNMRLLKKIEELTLYQIELMEKLERQSEQLLEQQKRIEKLENEE